MHTLDTPKVKPMLAAQCDDIEKLKYPVYGTPKIDGIRCLIINGVATSRSLKPIPNKFIQAWAHNNAEYLDGCDGELVVGKTFQDATSGIMSEEGQPDFTYFVFDHWNRSGGYLERAVRGSFVLRRAHFLLPVELDSPENLQLYLKSCLAEGWEGIVVRSPDGPYKSGRSTFKEGFMVKVKPFVDAEATIIGFEERLHNANEAKTNALGHTERSSHKANMVPTGTLGALVCENTKLWPGETFNIGTGFDDALRAEIWKNRRKYKGRLVKFKYQAIGTKDVPRIPVFLGFRDERDL